MIRKLLLVSALAGLAVPCASGALPRRPQTSWLHGTESYTNAHRKAVDIRMIVIHVTEGPFWGSVSWLENEQAHASAHYVVSRSGKIVQLVRQADIAWHAGNWKINTESIGIEHEGVTDDPAGFTMPEYRASARLVAWIARGDGIPIDRQHIIGHSEVPDPNDPTQFGGADHHTDPGKYWDWQLYMKLVRHYANPITPIHVLSSLRDGRSLAGVAPWHAKVRGGKVRRVDFLVDGKLVLRDTRPPFAVPRWNTTHVTNGRHLLELRAFGNGTKDVWRGAIVIHNRPLALKISGVSTGGIVSGVLRIRAFVHGAYGRSVSLYVDGKLAARRTRRPYAFAWNSRRAGDGYHTLQLVARDGAGRVASREVHVMVANAPAAKPAQIVAQSVAAGQTVSGVVPWLVTVRGASYGVQFFVDGDLRTTRTFLPFRYDWDTTKETPGPHRLTARLVRQDGTTEEVSMTVVVAAPSP